MFHWNRRQVFVPNVMNYSSKKEQIGAYFGMRVRAFGYERRFMALIATAIIALIIIFVTGEGFFVDQVETKRGAFTMICACIWNGLFNSIQNVCKERAAIKKEYREGLILSAYITAHMLFDFIICCLETIIMSIMIFANYYKNLPGFFSAIGIVLTILIVTYCSDVLGLLISSVSKVLQAAMNTVPFILIFQLVFAGLIFDLEGATARVSYFTISKWGYEAILSLCNMRQQWSWSTLGFENRSAAAPMCWAILILFAAGYAVLSTILLRLVEWDKR